MADKDIPMDPIDDDGYLGESKRDVLGYPPNPLLRRHLANRWQAIFGAIDIGDFETWLREAADLSYQEAKERMEKQFGSPKAALLPEQELIGKAKTAEEEAEAAYREATEARTIETELAELSEIAQKRQRENLELIRRQAELEATIATLKKELEQRERGVPASPPAPIIPVHGFLYEELKRLIAEANSSTEIDEVMGDLADIMEHKRYAELNQKDISEIIPLLQTKYSQIAAQFRKAPAPVKIKVAAIAPGTPVEGRAEKKERAEIYKYTRPQVITKMDGGETYSIDFELLQVIKANDLLDLPRDFFKLPPSVRKTRYGYSLVEAWKKAVAGGKYTWDELTQKYGIPQSYVEAWKK